MLSGVIGAFLAKRMEPFDAACAGVFVHAAAGRLVAQRIGPEGVIARDVIEALPGALRRRRGSARRSCHAAARARPRQPRGDRAQRAPPLCLG